MFEVGEAVVHPTRGAGVVIGFEEFKRHGTPRRYYKIQLLGRERTKLMIPVQDAEERGLRHPIGQARLFAVLRSDPEELPSHHKSRYKAVDTKLRSGNILKVAEAIRDLAWRRRKEDGLTVRERRVFRKAMRLVTGEISAAQGIDVEEAEAEVHSVVQKNLPTPTVA